MPAAGPWTYPRCVVDAGPGAAVSATRHNERLAVPWWVWPAALGFGAMLSAEVFLGAGGALTWVPYAIVLPAVAAGLWWLGRLRVAVGGGELRVDDARLPVRHIAGVTVLGPAEKRLLLGPAAQPYAFVVQRPWVPGAVQVHLDDPADPTPYWVVSSRRPDRLAAALLDERAAAGRTG